MYLIRAKKNYEKQDEKELQEKREKFNERYSQNLIDANEPVSNSPAAGPSNVGLRVSDQQQNYNQVQKSQNMSDSKIQNGKSPEFKPEDLPDGTCYRPRSLVESDEPSCSSKDGQSAVRKAEYINSFRVEGDDQAAKNEFVRQQLEQMTDVAKKKDVLLVISVSGLKVCSADEKSVYMAHALKRISYASCDPDRCQFSFLAREPKGHMNVQFCHAFLTKTKEQAEDLNTIIGDAFKMAYAQQRNEHQPTFNELIEQQLQEQKVKFEEYQVEAQKALERKLKTISTPTPFSPKAMESLEIRKQATATLAHAKEEREQQDDVNDAEAVGKSRIWARHLAGRSKHKDALDVSPRSSPSPVVKTRNHGSPSKSKQRARPVSEFFTSSPLRNRSPKRTQSPQPGPSNSSSSSSPSSQSVSPKSGNAVVSVTAIKQSLENRTNNAKNKFKGSPVTALKDSIDREFNLTYNISCDVPLYGSGIIITPLDNDKSTDNYLNPVCSHSDPHTASPEEGCSNKTSPSTQTKSAVDMLNRPLPTVPPSNGSPISRGDMNKIRYEDTPRQRSSLQSWSSDDDRFSVGNSSAGSSPIHSRNSRETLIDSSPSKGRPLMRNRRLVNGSNRVDLPPRPRSMCGPLVSGSYNMSVSNSSVTKTSKDSSLIFTNIHEHSTRDSSTSQGHLIESGHGQGVDLNLVHHVDSSPQLNDNWIASSKLVPKGTELPGKDTAPNLLHMHKSVQSSPSASPRLADIREFSPDRPDLISHIPRRRDHGSAARRKATERPHSAFYSSELITATKALQNYPMHPRIGDDFNISYSTPVKGDNVSELYNSSKLVDLTSSSNMGPYVSQYDPSKRGNSITFSPTMENKSVMSNINKGGNSVMPSAKNVGNLFPLCLSSATDCVRQEELYRYSISTDKGGNSNNSPPFPDQLNEERYITRAPRYQNDSPFQLMRSPDGLLRNGLVSGSGQSYGGIEVPLSPPSQPDIQRTVDSLDRRHIEDVELRHCAWYQPGIPREIALEILQQEEIGSFMVRDSTTHPGCYALSVKVPKFENPTGISHYLIMKTQQGVRLKGLDKEWKNLPSLVTHHTVMPELLPCTLRLKHNARNPSFRATDRDERDEDPDYQRLSDFNPVMSALKM